MDVTKFTMPPNDFPGVQTYIKPGSDGFILVNRRVIAGAASGSIIDRLLATTSEFALSIVSGPASIDENGNLVLNEAAGAAGDKRTIRIKAERDDPFKSITEDVIIETVLGVPVEAPNAPVITSLNQSIVAENAQLAFTLTADENVTWAIGDNDAGLFELSGTNPATSITLRWLANGTQDYESPLDGGANNTYNLTVQATSVASGLSTQQAHSTTVTNVDEATNTLVITGTPTASVYATKAYNTWTPDVQGGTAPLVFSLIGDWPEGMTINTSTGAPSGSPGTAGIYAGLGIRVTDADGFTKDLGPFTITVLALPVLVDLTFSNLSFPVGSASAFKIADITGQTAGTTIAITPNDGRLALNTDLDELLVGLTASSAGSVDYTVTQTHTASGVTHSQTITIICEAIESGVIPTVQPHASFGMTPLSGATGGDPIPVDPVRVANAGGKPAMNWIYAPRGMSIGADAELIGLEAECYGGLAYIDVWVEGTTQRLKRSRQQVYSPRTGAMEWRVGYWFWLSVPEEQRGATSKVRIFAKGVPNNSSMQERVIGWTDAYYHNGTADVMPPDTGVTGYRAPVDEGEQRAMSPMWVNARTSKYDYVKHVKADGTGDFTTFRLALDQLLQDINTAHPNVVAWDIVLHDADNDIGLPVSFTNRFGGLGGLAPTRIRAAQGVTARLFKNTSFDKYNTITVVDGVNCPAWDVMNFVHNVEFYGGHDGTNTQGVSHGKLVLDTAYYAAFRTRTDFANIIFNGAELTNTEMVNAGDMFHLYWNGVIASWIGFSNVNNPANVTHHLIDMDMKFVSIGYGALMDYRVTRTNGFANPHDNARNVVEGYITGFDGTYAISNKPALRVSYTGAAAGAWVRFSQPQGGEGNTLVELLAGATSGTAAVVGSVTLIHPQHYVDPNIGTASTGKSVFTMAQFCAWIDAQADFACVEPPASLASVWAAWTVQCGNYGYGTYTTADVKAATTSTGYLTMVSWLDSHNEAMHYYIANGGFENALMLRCVEVQNQWSTGHHNIEVAHGSDGSGSNVPRDVIAAYCLWSNTAHSYGYFHGLTNDGNQNGTGLDGDHLMMIGCTYGNSIGLYTQHQQMGPKTGIQRTLVTILGSSNNTSWDSISGPLIVEDSGFRGPPGVLQALRPPYQENSWLYGGDFQALFRSVDDMRPLATGQVANRQIAYPAALQAYDVTGTAYDETADVIGCFSKNAPAYTPPVATFSDATHPIAGDAAFYYGVGSDTEVTPEDAPPGEGTSEPYVQEGGVGGPGGTGAVYVTKQSMNSAADPDTITMTGALAADDLMIVLSNLNDANGVMPTYTLNGSARAMEDVTKVKSGALDNIPLTFHFKPLEAGDITDGTITVDGSTKLNVLLSYRGAASAVLIGHTIQSDVGVDTVSSPVSTPGSDSKGVVAVVFHRVNGGTESIGVNTPAGWTMRLNGNYYGDGVSDLLCVSVFDKLDGTFDGTQTYDFQAPDTVWPGLGVFLFDLRGGDGTVDPGGSGTTEAWNAGGITEYGAEATISNGGLTFTQTGSGSARLVSNVEITGKRVYEFVMDSMNAWAWIGFGSTGGTTYFGNDGGKGVTLQQWGNVYDTEGPYDPHPVAGPNPSFAQGTRLALYVDEPNARCWWTVEGEGGEFWGAEGAVNCHPDTPSTGYDWSALKTITGPGGGFDWMSLFPSVCTGSPGDQVTATFIVADMSMPVVASYQV